MSLVECEYGASLLSGGDLLGITSSGDSGELMVSRRNGQIQVYNLTSQCCVHSWQVSSSQTLTCPAVLHTLTYWTVVNETNVLTWHSDDTSLTQLDQELPSPAHCLLVSHGNVSPIVVLCDGSAHVLGTAIKRIKKKTKTKVHFADVFQNAGGDYVCIVSSTQRQVCVGVWRVTGGGVELVTGVTPDVKDLISYCICQDKLIALGSNSQLYTCPLDHLIDDKQLKLTPQSISSQPIRSQLVSLSAGYFVTYNNDCLSLWEPVYMTQQATVRTDPAMKVFTGGGFVCLCGAGDGVRAWSVDGGGGALALALGKRGNPPSLTVLDSNWETHSQTASESEGGQSGIATLLDREKTPTLDSFMAAFEMCTLNPDLCYSAVIERLLDETCFWGREALIKLINLGAAPLSASDGLLAVSAVHSDWWLAVQCLESCSGFSEAVLVDTIQTVIRLPHEVTSFKSTVTREKLLSLLLCQPFNDALLQQPLSQMAHTDVKALLQFIADHVGVAQVLTPPTSSYDSLLEWAAQLIDVHFTHLTLDPGAREVLVRLQSLVRDQVTCLNRLSLLRGVGGAHTALSGQPTTNGWLYRVETMDINI